MVELRIRRNILEEVRFKYFEANEFKLVCLVRICKCDVIEIFYINLCFNFLRKIFVSTSSFNFNAYMSVIILDLIFVLTGYVILFPLK